MKILFTFKIAFFLDFTNEISRLKKYSEFNHFFYNLCYQRFKKLADVNGFIVELEKYKFL